MRCSHCNMENPSDSRFCGNCGRPLETEDFGASGGNGQTQEGRVEERKPVKRTGKRIWVVTAGVVLILAAAVAVFLILGSRRDAKEMEDLLAKGDQYLEELDYKEAEDQYLESISIDPKKEEPYLRLAEIYVQQNQPQKAVKILEEGRKNTESDVIQEKYTLYSYVDEVLIPEKGECQEGEYLCKYNYTKNYMGLESVHSQKGVLTSRIRDFDGDGAKELLVLLLVNGEELDDEGLQYVSEGELVNGIIVQMYEMEAGEVVLKDEFQGLCPVLGYGDEESDGVFLQESEGTIYICGSLHQLVNTYADGSSIQSFVMTYEDGAFVRQTGSEELSVGSDFYEERESAWEMADFLEGIGLPGEAAQIRESYMRKFDFVDEVDDMLVRITGENDGTIDREAFFRTGSRYPEYLGNVIVRLQTTWEPALEEE